MKCIEFTAVQVLAESCMSGSVLWHWICSLLYWQTEWNDDCDDYSVSQKNIPDIFICNFRKHCRIFI